MNGPQFGDDAIIHLKHVPSLSTLDLDFCDVTDEGLARLNRLGGLARRRIEEAIAVSGAPASVTGSGSLFRVHMKAEPPTDYRSSFPAAGEAEALRRFIDGLYDAGIAPIHTGTIALSTAMGEAEIDRLAEAVLSSLRKVAVRAH